MDGNQAQKAAEDMVANDALGVPLPRREGGQTVGGSRSRDGGTAKRSENE